MTAEPIRHTHNKLPSLPFESDCNHSDLAVSAAIPPARNIHRSMGDGLQKLRISDAMIMVVARAVIGALRPIRRLKAGRQR